jgi:hypothetical protein
MIWFFPSFNELCARSRKQVKMTLHQSKTKITWRHLNTLQLTSTRKILTSTRKILTYNRNIHTNLDWWWEWVVTYKAALNTLVLQTCQCHSYTNLHITIFWIHICPDIGKSGSTLVGGLLEVRGLLLGTEGRLLVGVSCLAPGEGGVGWRLGLVLVAAPLGESIS